MSLIDTAKTWVFNIALKKGVVSAAKLIVSACITKGISASFSVGGIAIDTTNEAGMVVAINAGLSMLRNFLKIKFPAKFGWL